MEAFTAEELAEIVHELGLPAEVEVDDDHEVSISVVLDDLYWSIDLGSESPFYRSMTMHSALILEEDPLKFANQWNRDHLSTVLYTAIDPETDDPIVLESGENIVFLRSSIPFFGSVTKKFLSFLLFVWHDDVCELFGPQTILEDEEETEEAQRGEHDPIDRLLQIQLELRLRSPQSSRELTRSLKTTKYEINNILYHQPELFEKEGTSPPMWSNKGEIQ